MLLFREQVFSVVDVSSQVIGELPASSEYKVNVFPSTIVTVNVSPSLTKYIESSEKPFLPFTPKETFAEAYTEFYKKQL